MASYAPPPRKSHRPLPSPKLDLLSLKRPLQPVASSSSVSLPCLSVPTSTSSSSSGVPSPIGPFSTLSLSASDGFDSGYTDDEGEVSTVRRNDQIQQAIANLTLGTHANDAAALINSPTGSTSSDWSAHDSGLRWTEADLEDLGRLGAGSSGEVRKVRYRPTNMIMAKKMIATSPDPAVHKQILRELSFNRECDAPEIVRCFGASLEESRMEIAILMEYCEGGSLDAISRRVQRKGLRIGEKILGKISEAVLQALDYLHERKIIHRDIKPSNIVIDRHGQVKLCDLGVSGQLINSFAATFTGTSHYMAPERIRGATYTITSDIWSFGLTLYETAAGRFPFPPEGEAPLGPIELLSYIVKMDTPVLADDETAQWSGAVKDFLKRCLEKDPQVRPTPHLLLSHPWIKRSRAREVNMARWVAQVWDWVTSDDH